MLDIFGINLHPLAFLFLLFMVGLAAFVDSIAGGGGLISLPAYLLVGFPPITASATNKVTASCGAVMSFFQYFKKGYVNFKIAIPSIVTAIIGSVIGSNIAVYIDENIFKICLIIALPIAMYVVLNKDTFSDKHILNMVDKRLIIICSMVSLFIGMYDGFYGPGTGTFLIILFTKVARLKLDTANGVAKAINLATNLSAVVVFIVNGKSIIILGLICGIASIIGSYIGTHMYIKNGQKIVKPIMIGVLCILLIKIIYELVIGL